MRVDAVRLRQVLTNLAGNGIKFTATGGVTVRVVPSRVSDDTADLDFCVSDSGPGVSPLDAERIFEEFEQSDSALNRRAEGAGLGLAISRRIVRRMGGELRLDDDVLTGASFVFTLTLPVAEVETEPSPPRLDGWRVLIVAGKGAEAAVAARRLDEAGASARIVEALPAAGGLVAAALAAGQAYHALLVENGAAGFAAHALTELRRAAGSRLPAAVMIQPGKRAQIETLREAGYDAYLMRPLRRSSLVGGIASILIADFGFSEDNRAERGSKSPAANPDAALEVLLAEDNEINALLARAVLEGLGHRVTEVRDGAAAVAAVADRDAPFGAIMMDLRMPGLDGLTATREIRALEHAAGASPVPILALTADVLPETRITAEEAGITAMLLKPLTPNSLRGALAGLAG